MTGFRADISLKTILAMAVLALAAAAALVGGSPAGAQVSGSGCGPVPPGTNLTVNASMPVSTFTVPPLVNELWVSMEGGHGGQNGSTHIGGQGGGAAASIPVMPGECLTVFVGRFGGHSGGAGWAKGGSHGTTAGSSPGSSAAGGGGSSALVRGSTPLIVAGGGGGGGGDGQSSRSDAGGTGGDGGGVNQNPQGQNGQRARGGGGAGGGGGARKSPSGGGGDGYSSPSVRLGGAGGGGGGGLNGGNGGHLSGQCCFYIEGGGGGGGGTSAVPDPQATRIRYFTASAQNCPYDSSNTLNCGGLVSINWQAVTPSVPLSPVNQPELLIVPLIPQIQMLTLSLPSVVRNGVQGSVSPSGPRSLRLELFQRVKKRWRRVKTLLVNAIPEGNSDFQIRLPRKFRKRLLHSGKKVKGRRTGRMRLDAFDATTGAPISSRQLILD